MLFGNKYKKEMKEHKERHNRNKPNSHLANEKRYFSSRTRFQSSFSYLLDVIQTFYDNNKTTIEKFFTIPNLPTHQTVNIRLEPNETNATRDFKEQMEIYLSTRFAIDIENKESYYGIYTTHADENKNKSKISEGVIKTLVVLHYLDGFKSFSGSTNEFYRAIFNYKKESIIAKNYDPISVYIKEHRLHGNYPKYIISDDKRLIMKDIFYENKFDSLSWPKNENYYRKKTFYVQELGDLKNPQVFYDHIMTPKLIQIKDIEETPIPKQENSMSASSKEQYNYKINNNDNIIVTATEKVYTKKGRAGGKRTQKHKRRSKKRKTSRKTRRKHY
jgi:hypothetical protein